MISESVRRANRKWKLRNPEKVRAGSKRYRQRNLVRLRRSERNWKRCNPEKVRAGRKRYHQKNLGRLRKKSLDHYHKNKSAPVFIQATRDRRLRLRYGLTLVEVAGMLKKQSGKCAICNTRMLKPCVDHCHKTGKNRGLLCRSCNFGLGNFKESRKNFSSAMRYLKHHSKTQ